MVQMNPTVGDLDGNVHAMMRWVREARKAKADIVVFPELAVTGYPPEDLVLRPSFLKDTKRRLQHLTKACRGLTAVIGYLEEGEQRPVHALVPLIVPSGKRRIYNAAAVVHDGRLVSVYAKMILPNYGVFDESRYFSPGTMAYVHVVNGVRIGVTICEDIWYPDGPARTLALVGKAEVILNINASPYQVGKRHERELMLAERARANTVLVSYTNTVGGQDELIFDGNSLIVDHTGQVIQRGKGFEEDFLLADLDADAVVEARKASGTQRLSIRHDRRKVKRVVISQPCRVKMRPGIPPNEQRMQEPLEEVYRALVLGVRDYVRKNRFKNVLIGLSGGIDSALTATIATDALGAANVQCVFMPSPFTSRESREDVKTLVIALEVPLWNIPIAKLMNTYLKALKPIFQDRPFDTTEENIQARIRGNLLMALSNKFGHLVLTTGNKSEMSVGYATLYGDMAGGFAVIKDVSKTLVYELVEFRNSCAKREEGKELIPQRMVERPPSAELRANQTDQDSLPPYPILDPLLEAYVEDDQSVEEMIQMGFSFSMVRKVLRLVDGSEYKRRQAPVGIKITPRALGKDRRMPITNRYVKV